MIEGYGKEHRISVNSMLKKLGVSSSGYYSWKNRGESEQAKRKKRIKSVIKETKKISV